ncbi:MAG: hypothetical protein ACFB2X_12425 [Rivularia sp. (in: cyanobacteria)]
MISLLLTNPKATSRIEHFIASVTKNRANSNKTATQVALSSVRTVPGTA